MLKCLYFLQKLIFLATIFYKQSIHITDYINKFSANLVTPSLNDSLASLGNRLHQLTQQSFIAINFPSYSIVSVESNFRTSAWQPFLLRSPIHFQWAIHLRISMQLLQFKNFILKAMLIGRMILLQFIGARLLSQLSVRVLISDWTSQSSVRNSQMYGLLKMYGGS